MTIIDITPYQPQLLPRDGAPALRVGSTGRVDFEWVTTRGHDAHGELRNLQNCLREHPGRSIIWVDDELPDQSGRFRAWAEGQHVVLAVGRKDDHAAS